MTAFCLPVSFLVGFLLCLILMPPYIRWLKTRQIGQFIREEGPASHAVKAHTPTMGGACFISSSLIASVVLLSWFGWLTAPSAIVLLVAALCGLVGLLDDLSKLKRQKNTGLSARSRLAAESALGLTAGALLLVSGGGTELLLPHASLSGNTLSGPVFVLPLAVYILLSGFLVAATTNAVNLHDGMDGLAAGTAIQILLSLGVILLGTNQMPLAVVALTAAGSLGAFLIFNRYPASVFMGDTGSLYIGGLLALLALAGRIEIWFVPLTFIYIIETLSVMAQVVYFKLTKEYKPVLPASSLQVLWTRLTKRLPGEGKRLFRMAPLHHHFEALGAEKGRPEWKTVAGFWWTQLLICLMVLAGFKLL